MLRDTFTAPSRTFMAAASFRPPMRRFATSAATVFNRDLKLLQRERVALSPHVAQYSYLRDEIAERLMDRLDDVHESYSFADAVDLCAGTGHIRRALAGRGGVERLREFDRSEAMLAASEAEEKASAAANADGGSEDADDGHDDHQLDKGEAFF